MSDRSAIEWTDASWNPVRARRRLEDGTVLTGWFCTHASPGCANCYAEGFNLRLGTGLPYKPGHLGDVEIYLDEKMLTLPLQWKRPRRIFVGSMTDLFADFVSDDWLEQMFAVMAAAHQHSFQVLTKRPARMREFFAETWQPAPARDIVIEGKTIHIAAEMRRGTRMDRINHCIDWLDFPLHRFERFWTPAGDLIGRPEPDKPLPNVWLGVSVEDQKRANERIPDLLATPAAVRFLSCEPLLGPLDLTRVELIPDSLDDRGRLKRCGIRVDTLAGKFCESGMPYCPQWDPIAEPSPPAGLFQERSLDWVICGGESGPNARPMHPDWARSLRDQCQAAGVPFFFKQWGEWAPHRPVAGGDLGGDVRRGFARIVHPSGRDDVQISEATGGLNTEPGSRYMARLGKKVAGRLLDGAEHNGMPA